VPEPVGIVAAFTAWNFPVNLVARKIAPALAAGCPVICRPSEQTPLTSTLIALACVEGGAPAGVVQMAHGPADVVTPPLMEADEVRKISLTGSTRVGKLMLAQAAQTVKRASMELGGHAPVVVCEDADVGAALPSALPSSSAMPGRSASRPAASTSMKASPSGSRQEWWRRQGRSFSATARTRRRPWGR